MSLPRSQDTGTRAPRLAGSMSLSPSVNRIETHSANCWFAAAISRASEAFNFGFNSRPRLSWQGKSERWRSACSWLMRCASRATEHRPCVMRCRQDLLGRRSVWCGWQWLRRWREHRGNCGDEHGHEHNFTHFSVAALSRRIDYGGIRGVALCPPPAFDSLSSTHNAAPRGLYTGPLGGQPHG